MTGAKALALPPQPLLAELISQAPGLLKFKIIPLFPPIPGRKHKEQNWSQTDLVLNLGPATS